MANEVRITEAEKVKSFVEWLGREMYSMRGAHREVLDMGENGLVVYFRFTLPIGSSEVDTLETMLRSDHFPGYSEGHERVLTKRYATKEGPRGGGLREIELFIKNPKYSDIRPDIRDLYERETGTSRVKGS